MDQEKAQRDAIGRAVWAAGMALGLLLSVGVCSAGQLGADSTARSCDQIEAAQI